LDFGRDQLLLSEVFLLASYIFGLAMLGGQCFGQGFGLRL
jgi:hypothetical protein